MSFHPSANVILSLLHDAKAPPHKFVKLADNKTFSKLEHHEKHESPVLVTDSGILIVF